MHDLHGSDFAEVPDDPEVWDRDPEGLFPCILGHEAAGYVSAQDSYYSGKPLIVDDMFDRVELQLRWYGSTYVQWGELQFIISREPLLLVNTLLCMIDPKAHLEKVCLLGCGVPTGSKGAKAAGATRIIGIDIDNRKFDRAKDFGVTEFVNPKDHDKSTQQVLVDMTDGGVDYSFECIGNVSIMRAALELSSRTRLMYHLVISIFLLIFLQILAKKLDFPVFFFFGFF
ncbi:putative oxidoreductase [Helianthus anomalus]